MTLNLVKPGAVVSSSFARWLIYGENGTGKSTLAATMPTPTMVISAVGENMAPYSGKDGVIINLLSEWSQVQETLRMLKNPQTPFKSVVWDTLTRIMGLYLDEETGVKRDAASLESYLRQGKPKTKRDWSTWENLGFMSTLTVQQFNELPLHTLYLCQEDTKRPQYEQDILETMPMLSPASWKGVKDVVHLLGRLYVAEASGGDLALLPVEGNRSINPNRKDQRMLLIGKHDRYYTKGDTQTLGYCVENPSWDNLSKSLKQ